MKFNTAILYDVENLIGGYARMDMLSNLSLPAIYQKIDEKINGKVAIQRAYANWSDQRLSMLRTDINELGIEPVQMFGFGKGAAKNASDIQLAVEAIDIAFTRPVIETFVIVSGDGGFSAVAKKLHEYGKMVIGCAYPKTTNKVFEAVCDDFIWLEVPTEVSVENGSHIPGVGIVTDPIVSAYVSKYAALDAPSKEAVLQNGRDAIRFLCSHSMARQIMSSEGLNISIISQMLNYRLRGFNYQALGFSRFVDFLRHITCTTPCRLAYKPPSEYRLVVGNHLPPGFELTTYIKDLPDLHTAETYRNILTRGLPSFRCYDRLFLENVADHMVMQKLDYQNLYFGEILEKLQEAFPHHAQGQLKTAIQALLGGGCFLRKPEEVHLSEQRLSFIPVSKAQCMDMVLKAMKEKLARSLEEPVRTNIFNAIWENQDDLS